MKTILKLILILAVLAVTFSSCVVRERVYAGPYVRPHYTAVYYR
ncbi:MAG TPA: hypothetical protein VGZ90_18075 [Puia sp.]|nr:hypothetical protein [Puia sp.]